MNTSEHLIVGKLYSRNQLRELFGINDATINTGIFQPMGHSSVWLFVTEQKTPDRTQYDDRLEGDNLYFEGQTEGRTDALIKRHTANNHELLLFHRMRKNEHPHYAFRYEGPFEFVGAEGNRPTKFHLRRVGAQPVENPEVDLEKVRATDEIRDNLVRFARAAKDYSHRVTALASQTTYWVFDENTDEFAPNKFVGFRSMTFARYEAAVRNSWKTAIFNGRVARDAVESVLGSYVEDLGLIDTLSAWLIQKCGTNVLTGVDTSKWKFTRLKARQYWALVCNPDRYDARAALSQLEMATWLFDRGDPHIGDMAIIWQAKGGGSERGVIACVEILSNATVMEELLEERSFWISTRPGAERRCRIRVLPAPGLPLWESQNPELLADLAAARARGGTVFSLEREQWDAIWEAANHVESVISSASAGGQGFQPDSKCRLAIERYAQRLAEEHFVAAGYDVTDVSSTHPFDLLCRRVHEELRVEVKGSTGNGSSVILTRNEVEHARRNEGQVALFVVSQIAMSKASGEWVADGGIIHIHLPWAIDDGTLVPIGYTYTVPASPTSS